jgi:hypothetical protein
MRRSQGNAMNGLESPLFKKRKALFGKIVTTVNDRFDENFPE